MSLQRLEKLSDNILNLVIHVPSPSLDYFIKSTLKQRFKVHGDFVINAETEKALNEAKLDSFVAPLLCDKWLIFVNADKLTRKEIFKNLEKNTAHGITVYFTTQYRVYRQLTDSDIVKRQSVYCPVFSYSRLDYSDIMYLYSKMVDKNKLDRDLLNYVAKNYRYDVQAVCELFTLVRSGAEITSKRDIIESIGVGGNSVSSLTIRILRAEPKNDKGRKTILSNIVKLIDDLSVSYNHQTIRRFMINNIEGFIEMKQLQIMGLYGRVNKEIPDSFDQKRLSMLRRFEYTVLNDVSLAKLLNLKICLQEYSNFNTEIALIQAISTYLDSLKTKEVEK